MAKREKGNTGKEMYNQGFIAGRSYEAFEKEEKRLIEKARIEHIRKKAESHGYWECLAVITCIFLAIVSISIFCGFFGPFGIIAAIPLIIFLIIYAEAIADCIYSFYSL